VHKDEVLLIGYSGHALVICDIFLSMGVKPTGYFDNVKKILNPFFLKYMGSEKAEDSMKSLKEIDYFVAIGDNKIRQKITETVSNFTSKMPINAIHKNASISLSVIIGKGTMVGDGSIINACAKIGDGVICNTQSVIEHECEIGDFSHIAPGAVLCGNVKVGTQTFIGARAVIKQGVTIGDNVTIGAGTVVIKNIPSNSIVVGNPQKNI
jgi:sugar O-acyltransferase (sialic acid O-acetyltransferase NeuD family)